MGYYFIEPPPTRFLLNFLAFAACTRFCGKFGKADDDDQLEVTVNTDKRRVRVTDGVETMIYSFDTLV